MDARRITIVVPVLNEAEGSGRALQALKPLRAGGHEGTVGGGGRAGWCETGGKMSVLCRGGGTEAACIYPAGEFNAAAAEEALPESNRRPDGAHA